MPLIAKALAVLLSAAPCPRAYRAVENDACVVLPEKPAAVVVYFHGMLPGGTDWSRARELSLLGAEAKKRNVALVALKGEQGLCAWAEDVKQHWCWPSDLSQREDAYRVHERVERVLGGLKLPKLPAPVYAGFSNGGYFVSMLATESTAKMSAMVVMHAGNLTGQSFDHCARMPALLLGASRDSIQLPTMKRLHGMLEEARWPVKLTVRDGVHEVTPADAKALFDFVDTL